MSQSSASGQPGLFDDQHKATGNKCLVDYGIQNELSDYRIHVGYRCRTVMVFKTVDGVRALAESSDVKKADVSLDGKIVTAQGYPVPLSRISGLLQVTIPATVADKFPIYETDTPDIKGFRSVQIVQEMLRRGIIPLPLQNRVLNEISDQVDGKDMIVWGGYKIQVKCDFRAGPKPDGTGNIFLQTRECNPYRYF